jgi:hypothetical protein
MSEAIYGSPEDLKPETRDDIDRRDEKLCRQCKQPYDRPARHDLCSMDCVAAFEKGEPPAL